MVPYISKAEAIADMHQRGFTHVFQLFGNDLLWVQEKIFIRMGGFSFIEYHRFRKTRKLERDVIFFGVFLPDYNAKGILINNYSGFRRYMPPVIIKKLSELVVTTALRANF